MSKLLLDENPLVIIPSLAKKIGLNEAIFIQQVHYWLQISKNTENGKKWAYNTYEQLELQFPFWSQKTIKRIVTNLKDAGYLLVENLSKDTRDKTNWYSIDYAKFDVLMDGTTCPDGAGQNDPMHKDKMTRCIETNCPDVIVKSFDRDYTETTTETTTENIKKIEPLLPFWLDKEAWKRWVAFRKELKKPLTKSTIELQLALLEENKKNHVEIINQSIMNGWQGLFKIKATKGTRDTSNNLNLAEKWLQKNERESFADNNLYFDAEVAEVRDVR
jgi:hypothetical protein